MKTCPALLLAGAALMPLTAADSASAAPALRLHVDATDVDRGILTAEEHIPVKGGQMLRLRFPQWIPGDHSPTGPINQFAGLRFQADGKPVAWKRDSRDVYAIMVTPPAGATDLVLNATFLSPIKSDQGRVTVTQDMLSVSWHQLSLYPAGRPVGQIPVVASIRLPDGWQSATALEPDGPADHGVIRYRRVSYETLVDSPLLSGRYARREDLGHGVALNLMADAPQELAATSEQIGRHRALVNQAMALFGVRHFDHYDFLVSISDTMGAIGLEHHRSNESGLPLGYFTRWDERPSAKNLLPHEFVHSWNGKYRRGRGAATPDYATPMEDSLLWVYEGQTQFWGTVLQARSGLSSREQVLDALAAVAATQESRAGRAWRPLIDTTNDPVMANRRPNPWPSLERSEDYYNEGMLVWLEADMLIREGTDGKRSLDDFARRFFGGKDRDWGVSPYDRGDVATALNAIYPHDWEDFFQAHIDQPAPHAPLDWIARGGYRLTYTVRPGITIAADEKARKLTNLSWSLGMTVKTSGEITQVLWDSPAFAAKLTPAITIMAVNGAAYSAEVMKAALDKAATGTQATGKAPIELTVKKGDRIFPVSIDYHAGQRYPHLERSGATPARLDTLLAPLPG